MKILLCGFFILALQTTQAQTNNKSGKQQYGFIMVVNKEATKLYFSPVFSFQIDRRGDPLCNLYATELSYREKVADKSYDVLTSDYFDSKEEADQARKDYINSEKKAGRKVEEPAALVGDCK